MRFKINFFSKIIVILLLLLSAINIYAENIPNWIINPKSIYDENKYLSAVGEGLTLKDAQINAYINLSKTFSISVDFDAASLERWNETGKNVDSQSLYYENTKLQSYAELFGVEFKEAHYSPNENIYRVLAVIDKEKSIKILSQKIRYNEMSINEYMNNMSNNPIERYSVLDIVLVLAKKNQMYYDELIVLGVDNISLKYNASQIESMKLNEAKNMTFNLVMENNYSALAQTIESTVSKSGFKLTKSNPAYNFNIRIDWSDSRELPDFAGGGFMVYYQFQIDLLDRNGDLIYTFNFGDQSNGRQHGFTEAEARKYILTEITKTVKEEFKGKFLDFFNQYI